MFMNIYEYRNMYTVYPPTPADGRGRASEKTAPESVTSTGWSTARWFSPPKVARRDH